jgi:hypothetical protein
LHIHQPYHGKHDHWASGRPPLEKFKKGQEAEAKAWAECVPGWSISLNGRSGKYAVDFCPHNGAKPSHHPECRSLDEAKEYIYKRDPKAVPTVS